MIRHKLPAYCHVGTTGVRVFMRRPHFHQSSEEEATDRVPKFFELDVAKSLRDNLAGKSLIEFPIVFVALPGMEDAFLVTVATGPTAPKGSDDSSSDEESSSSSDEGSSSDESSDHAIGPSNGDADKTEPAAPLEEAQERS